MGRTSGGQARYVTNRGAMSTGSPADRPAAVAALTKIFISRVERLLYAAAGVTSNAHSRPPETRPSVPLIGETTAFALLE